MPADTLLNLSPDQALASLPGLAALVVLGAVLGSFAGMLAWRLRVEQLGSWAWWRGVLGGRSACPHCGHTLSAWDLVPVASWLLLRGRCRYCSRTVSWRYAACEALCAVLFPLLVLALLPHTAGWAAAGATLLWAAATAVAATTAAVHDAETLELPDATTIALALLAIPLLIASPWQLAAAAAVGLGALALQRGSQWAYGQVALGTGDVKLAPALALWLPPQHLLLWLLASTVLASLLAIPLLLRQGRGAVLPLGPFLLLGWAITLVAGHAIIAAYWGWIGM